MGYLLFLLLNTKYPEVELVSCRPAVDVLVVQSGFYECESYLRIYFIISLSHKLPFESNHVKIAMQVELNGKDLHSS